MCVLMALDPLRKATTQDPGTLPLRKGVASLSHSRETPSVIDEQVNGHFCFCLWLPSYSSLLSVMVIKH